MNSLYPSPLVFLPLDGSNLYLWSGQTMRPCASSQPVHKGAPACGHLAANASSCPPFLSSPMTFSPARASISWFSDSALKRSVATSCHESPGRFASVVSKVEAMCWLLLKSSQRTSMTDVVAVGGWQKEQKKWYFQASFSIAIYVEKATSP